MGITINGYSNVITQPIPAEVRPKCEPEAPKMGARVNTFMYGSGDERGIAALALTLAGTGHDGLTGKWVEAEKITYPSDYFTWLEEKGNDTKFIRANPYYGVTYYSTDETESDGWDGGWDTFDEVIALCREIRPNGYMIPGGEGAPEYGCVTGERAHLAFRYMQSVHDKFLEKYSGEDGGRYCNVFKVLFRACKLGATAGLITIS